MKMLTLNFLTCPRKACKSSPASFPLHPADAVLLPSSPTCSYIISKETIFGLYEKLLSVARRLVLILPATRLAFLGIHACPASRDWIMMLPSCLRSRLPPSVIFQPDFKWWPQGPTYYVIQLDNQTVSRSRTRLICYHPVYSAMRYADYVLTQPFLTFSKFRVRNGEVEDMALPFPSLTSSTSLAFASSVFLLSEKIF
jgi:hypothetical protein